MAVQEVYEETNEHHYCAYRILERLHKNRVIKVIYQQEEQEELDYSNKDYNKENIIRDSIYNHKAIAACNALVRE